MNTASAQVESAVAYEVDGQILTEEQYSQFQAEKLQELYKVFTEQRDEWVTYRANLGVEKRWRMAEELYQGEVDGVADSDFVDSLKNGPKPRGNGGGQPNRSKVVINIVRPKVDQAIARMCEILLPVDDKNWGIKPTPVPDVVKGMLGNTSPTVDPTTGQPTGRTADEEAQIVVKQAKEAARLMEKEIDDVLTECNYNGEQRRAITFGVKFGPAMMLGPFPKNNAKREWIPIEGGGMDLKITHDVNGASMAVNPWDIWLDPACGNDHQRGAGFFHKRDATKKELRALVGVPGFDQNAIREVLKEKPTRVKVVNNKIAKTTANEDSYEMWVYYGQVEPEQMERLSEAMEGDPLQDVQDGMIIIVGDKVIGAMKSTVPDGSLPLDIWCWRDQEDHPYGDGLPMELVHQQRVVNASWRQVMDDAKFSVGGQLVINKKMIQPTDGNYTIYPGKSWLANSDLDDVRKAMSMIEFQNHSQPLLQIATAAMQFADQETSMPQLLGGEKGNQAPETLGGMVMLYNNAQTVLRLKVKLYDDRMTKPHIGRHFDYQMANNPKNEIKGDMEIDARGSTALLEKDIQNQNTLNLANLTSNPRYQPYLDPKEELKILLGAMKVPSETILLTDDKVQQNLKNAQEQTPDPRVQTAQIAAESKMAELEDRKEARAVEQQMHADEVGIKREGLAYNSERERAEGEQRIVDRQIDREIAIAKMQQDNIESTEERASRERLQAIDIDATNQRFNAEMSVKVRQGSGI